MNDDTLRQTFLGVLPTWPDTGIREEAWQRLAGYAADNAEWLIAEAMKAPYFHLDGYMDRFWLTNPYPSSAGPRPESFGPYDEGLSSSRVHHILRADGDRFPHDHPWTARTIILSGWYREMRLMADGTEKEFLRQPGDTVSLNYGEYHRIIEVSEGGVWTLFITWKYQGTWGFLVDGRKVPYKQYLGIK